MRRFLRWLFGLDSTPSPRAREIERRLDDVEDEMGGVKQRHENLRGQVLTLTRRVNRLATDPDDDDEEEDELDRIIQRRRGITDGG